MHNSIQILLTHHPPQKKPKKTHKQKFFINENIWLLKQVENTVSQKSYTIRGDAAPLSTLHLEGDGGGEKQRYHLFSLHFRAGSTVPSVQCRHASIPLLLSPYLHVSPIPRGLKELTWGGEMGPWLGNLLHSPCPFPWRRGALAVHSTAALTLVVPSHRSAQFCWPGRGVWV